ncbi:LacI family DNA-binding transcriptional regulator [Nocardioides sp. KR10-350]|uniref:LacI family DNA-binding transcriptional regulator n=1 Tax=Nocardioides cheoyonin TaxID=3156615 RepID=UPI0032B39E40
MTTIYDVATRAGVSAATVSRVLNGSDSVAPDLARRVRDAVAELDYRPNGVARNLRRRATRVWGLIISDIGNPFFTALVRGVEDAAHEAGYSLVLCNSDEILEKEQSYIQVAVDEQMAGVILTPSSEADSDLTPLLERGIPVVAVDRRLDRHDVDTVVGDNVRGALLATQHLIASGCRRIACITGPTKTTTAQERLHGYRQALTREGIDVDEGLVMIENFKEDGGYAGATGLLDLDERPDGLFVANNLMTVGALEALVDRGVEVPRDLLIVGFDDIPWAKLTRPRLTTVDQPTYQMGKDAGTLLAGRLGGNTGPARTIMLSPTLQVRESSVRS